MAFALVAALPTTANAATFTGISVTPTDPTANTSSTTFTVNVGAGTWADSVNCLKIAVDTTVAFDSWELSGAPTAVGSGTFFTGAGSWGVPALNSNEYQSARSGGDATTTNTASNFTFTAPKNAAAGTYYLRVRTYSGSCAGTLLDEGVAMFALTDNTLVTAVVDPTFTFTVADEAGSCNGVANSGDATAGATSVNLGRVNTSANKAKNQRFTVSTNAANGYTVYARSTGAMSDGNGHTITDWTGTNGTPTASWAAGTEAFGYTVGDASLSTGPGAANRFTSGGPNFAGLNGTNAEVAYAATGPVSNEVNCIAYQIGVAGSTEAGAYTTSVIYTAVPVF